MSKFLFSVHRRIPTELWVVKNGHIGIELPLKNFANFHNFNRPADTTGVCLPAVAA